jgi:hypothetical protein
VNQELAAAGGTAHANATCVFINVGTTVPETVMRHVYGINVTNAAATFNNVHVYHVPDGGTGTQYFFKFLHLYRGEDAIATKANLQVPLDPNPLAPIFVLEGGSKLYASSATASLFITVSYWDDILTGIEDT